jgi:hypothetical protein
LGAQADGNSQANTSFGRPVFQFGTNRVAWPCQRKQISHRKEVTMFYICFSYPLIYSPCRLFCDEYILNVS